MQAGKFILFMDTRSYAPWEHYPKTLTHDEMMNPLSVVEDFFTCESVKGHSRRLKEWRHYAVNDAYYNDEKWGPGPLLFIYTQNLKLLEAVFLLLCDHRNMGYRRQIATEDQLQEERANWEFFPKNLPTRTA